MTKSDFIDWKASPLTKALFNRIQGNILGLQEELGKSAGVDTRLDAIKVGAIQAYNDVLDIDFDGGDE